MLRAGFTCVMCRTLSVLYAGFSLCVELDLVCVMYGIYYVSCAGFSLRYMWHLVRTCAGFSLCHVWDLVCVMCRLSCVCYVQSLVYDMCSR